MDEIQFLSGAPSLYTNHVVIERTRSDTYRFEGLSNAGNRVQHVTSRHFGDLAEAKSAAAQWASENGVRLIYLPPDASLT